MAEIGITPNEIQADWYFKFKSINFIEVRIENLQVTSSNLGEEADFQVILDASKSPQDLILDKTEEFK